MKDIHAVLTVVRSNRYITTNRNDNRIGRYIFSVRHDNSIGGERYKFSDPEWDTGSCLSLKVRQMDSIPFLPSVARLAILFPSLEYGKGCYISRAEHSYRTKSGLRQVYQFAVVSFINLPSFHLSVCLCFIYQFAVVSFINLPLFY